MRQIGRQQQMLFSLRDQSLLKGTELGALNVSPALRDIFNPCLDLCRILNKTRHAASNTNEESLVTWCNTFAFSCGALNLLDCSLLGSLVARLLSREFLPYLIEHHILGSSGDYFGLIDQTQTQQLNGCVVDVIVGSYHAQVEGDSVHVILNADTIAVLQLTESAIHHL